VHSDPTWTADDLAGTARAVDEWWRLLAAGVTPLTDGLATSQGRVSELAAVVRAGGDIADVGPAATALVAELSAAGRAVHARGLGPRPHRGRVTGLHVSDGGVPKRPVDAADIGWRGLSGDRQWTRRHHGRIWQAVCLWSADVIDRLVAEGHPIFPGAAGENVTLAGVDWGGLRPGTRLRVGGALVEITVPAAPCFKNAQWFVGGHFDRIDHSRHPGESRLYALVVAPGAVNVGDEVVVEPAP
jgi:MOSC domain-containing protein YiiM